MSDRCQCIDPERHGHLDECPLAEIESLRSRLAAMQSDADLLTLQNTEIVSILTDLEAERALLVQRAENAEAALAYAVSTGDECAIEVEALRKDAERYRDDAREYHRVMGWLRATKMQHGQCQPRERLACTHCNAVDSLEAAITAYRGPPVILAAAMEWSHE